MKGNIFDLHINYSLTREPFEFLVLTHLSLSQYKPVHCSICARRMNRSDKTNPVKMEHGQAKELREEKRR